jgi:hypothetical protein
MVMGKLMAQVMAPVGIALAIGIAAAPRLDAQALRTDPDMAAVRAAKNEVFLRLSSTLVEIHGRLTASDRTALTMEVDGRSFTFPFNEVLRIDVMGNHVARGTAIGGLAIGSWCALVCGQGLDNSGQLAAVVAANGAVGAGVGALIGYNHKTRKTVYASAGSGAAVSRAPAELPCPATPLVLEADMSNIDLLKLSKEYTAVLTSRAFGAARCDGVTIQRNFDPQTGAWQPGVEMAAGAVRTDRIDVHVRVTARNPKGGRSMQAHVDVGLWQGGRPQVSSIMTIDAESNQENSREIVLRVPRTLLPASSSGLSLRLTLTTSYPH